MREDNSLNRAQLKLLILSSLGGVLEYFDFIIFIFLVPYIEKLFFVSSASYVAHIKSLAIFAVGYLIRPFGGILFSHFGDKYGRKVVFLLTILFMALPSLAIGLLPTAQQIGVMAPILLLIFRIMQGLALGGEIPAAITFVSEHVPQRQGLATAVLFFGINIGLMFGSLATALLTDIFTEAQILAYAWRILFILGGLFGLISIFLRRYLKETQAFKAIKQEQHDAIPLLYLVKNHASDVLQGAGLVAIAAICFSMFLYWPGYLTRYMHFDYSATLHLNTLSTLVMSISIILGGIAADRFGYHKIYLLSALFILLSMYPLFLLFNQNNIRMLYLGYLGFSIVFGLLPGCYGPLLARIFPTRVRYTGIALSYNITFAIIGGLSPLMCSVLIPFSGSIFAPAALIMVISFASVLACIYGMQKSRPLACAII